MAVDYRSFSQWNQYRRCPYAYYLQRIERKWERPAAWSPMGTAVHAGMEYWERSSRTATLDDIHDHADSVYVEAIDRYLDKTPNLGFWFASGPYKAEADIPRRRDLIRKHLEDALAWYEKHPDERLWWLSSDRPAVELEFYLQLGTVKVRGFIDWIGEVSGGLRPRDYKSGRKPGDLMQLKLYGIAVEDHFASRDYAKTIDSADFFMTRTGKPTLAYDLTSITRDEVVVEFEKLDSEIRAGDFPPDPSPDKCWSCSVRDSCRYKEA